MGKHYSRKRFNPGQKHALNDKLREAERKRRPFPNFDEWVRNNLSDIDEDSYPLSDFRSAMDNYTTSKYEAEDSDGLSEEEGRSMPYDDDKTTQERQSHNWYYGDDQDDGVIANPRDAVEDYAYEPMSNGETPSEARKRWRTGDAKEYYLDEKLNNMGGEHGYASDNPNNPDYTTYKPNPLLIHDFNKVHKQRELQKKKNELLEHHTKKLDSEYLQKHIKPAFEDSRQSIGETVLPFGHLQSDTEWRDSFNKKKKK